MQVFHAICMNSDMQTLILLQTDIRAWLKQVEKPNELGRPYVLIEVSLQSSAGEGIICISALLVSESRLSQKQKAHRCLPLHTKREGNCGLTFFLNFKGKPPDEEITHAKF